MRGARGLGAARMCAGVILAACAVAVSGPAWAQDDVPPGPDDVVGPFDSLAPDPAPSGSGVGTPVTPETERPSTIAPPLPDPPRRAAPDSAPARPAPATPAAAAPPPAMPAPSVSGSARPAINRSAMAALDRMSTYLRSLQELDVEGETTTDDVLASGQKVQYGGKVKLRIKRPDRMAAEVVTDRKNEQMYYDGTTFTVYQPKIGYYASFAAPPDLRGLVDVLERRYGVDLPLADLFRWGTDTGQVDAIQRATYLGKSDVRGKRCSHYAFHQADVDWEVWIQDGDQPVPLKLAITTLTDRTLPRHVDVLTWNLDPRPDPLAFTFTPPPNAQRISFDLAGAPSPSTRQARAPAPRRRPTP